MNKKYEDLINRDKKVLWHPYSSMVNAPPVFPVVSASGVRIKLANGQELIDGMASWWCAIHGYNHPVINAAIEQQVRDMAHVMFGGLTHEPAVKLAETLVSITPEPLQSVFFSDSGSVSVEVAIKMAIQYWAARQRRKKQKLLTIRQGYHGDTMGAMSVCDPVTGMHSMFNDVLTKHFFADAPSVSFSGNWNEEDIKSFKNIVEQNHDMIAAVILEPVVQGAGAMWFYSPRYLKRVREICDEYDILLIADEIATGFGRSGKLFACEHADISPDLMCVGKALTGGYLTLAATLATEKIAQAISDKNVFMHGPTFMANPLACTAAQASIDLLLSSDWQQRIKSIESQLREELQPCSLLDRVADVRILGAIGVVELKEPVDMHKVPGEFVNRGVWIRPFGKLVYIMPPYIIKKEELSCLTSAMREVINV